MTDSSARFEALTSLDALLTRGPDLLDALGGALRGPDALPRDARFEHPAGVTLTLDDLARLEGALSFHAAHLDDAAPQRFGRVYDALRWARGSLAAVAEGWRVEFERRAIPWVRSRRPLLAQPTDWPHRVLPGFRALLAGRAPVALVQRQGSTVPWRLGAPDVGGAIDGTPVSLSDDGRLALVSTRDALSLWDLSTGARVWTHGGFATAPRAAVITRDGSRVVAVDDDALRVIDASTGALVARSEGLHLRNLLRAGDHVVAWGHVDVARVDLDTARPAASWRAPAQFLAHACGADDGTVFASVYWTGVHALDARTCEPRWSAPLRAQIGALACTPSGDRAVVGTADGSEACATVYDGRDGRAVTALRKRGWTSHVAVAPSGERVIADGSLWDARTGERVAPVTGRLGLVGRALYSHDERWIVGEFPGGLCVWDTTACAPRTPPREGTARRRTFVVAGELVCSDEDRSERWDLDGRWIGAEDFTVAQAFPAHGTAVATRGAGERYSDGFRVWFWRLDGDARDDLGVASSVGTWDALDGFVVHRPDGRCEARDGRDGTLRWERAGSVGEVLRGGRWARCTAGERGVIVGWRDGAEVLALGDGVRLVEASADGSLVACTRGGDIELWEVAAATLRWRAPAGLPGAAESLQLSPDATTLRASCSSADLLSEETVTVTRSWTTATGDDRGTAESSRGLGSASVSTCVGDVEAVSWKGQTQVYVDPARALAATLPVTLRAVSAQGAVLLVGPEGPSLYELRRPTRT